MKDLREQAAKGVEYSAYRAEFDRQVAQGESTSVDAAYGAEYMKLNLARTRRLEKTVKVPDETLDVMAMAGPQTWLVLTESWCGDSAQNLPVINALAELTTKITLRILRRDEHLELMDRYLTGTSRSIPKLIAFDTATGKELFTWGPRPTAAHDLVMAQKDQLPKEALAEALHRWYNSNGGKDVMSEMVALVKK